MNFPARYAVWNPCARSSPLVKFPVRSARARIFRRASRRLSAKNLACSLRPSPRKLSSATFTRNFNSRWRSSARASNVGRSSSVICNAPKYWKPKNRSRKARKVPAPCRTSVIPLLGSGSPVSRACCAATRWRHSKMWRCGMNATFHIPASNGLFSPTPAHCSIICSGCSRG